MPRPSRFIASEFREVDQSLAGVDRSGEIEAKSLQTLGQGLEQLGAGMAMFNDRKKAADDKMLADHAVNASLAAGQEAENFSVTNPDGNPDGSDMVDTFEEGYEELKQNYMDGLHTDEQRDRAGIIFEGQKLNRAEGLFTAQRKKGLEFIINTAEQNAMGRNTIVMNDPSKFSEALASSDQANIVLGEAGVLMPDQLESVKKTNRKNLIYSAIDGMTMPGIGEDYKEAVQDVMSGRFSMLLNRKEKSALIQTINNRKYETVNQNAKENAAEIMERNAIITENERENFSNIMGRIINAKDSDARLIIQSDIRRLTGKGMNKADSDYALKVLDSAIVPTLDDNQRSFDIAAMIIDNVPFTQVESIIKSDVVNEKLNPATGQNLLGQVNAQRDRMGLSGRDIHSQQMSLAKGRLDALFGSKTLIEKLGFKPFNPMAIRRNQAGKMLLEKMMANPTTDPQSLADLVGIEMGNGDINRHPLIPGIPAGMQNSIDKLDQSLSGVKVRRESGALTAREAARKILQIKQRVDLINALDDMKTKVKSEADNLKETRRKAKEAQAAASAAAARQAEDEQ